MKHLFKKKRYIPLSEERFIPGTEIKYTLTLKAVKNLNLRIKKEGEILVSAPYKVTQESIDVFLVSKLSFIINHLNVLEANKGFDILTFEFSDGGEFYYLGRPYEFRVMQASGNSVTLSDNKFIVFSTMPTDKLFVEKQVYVFLKDRALELFPELTKKMYEPFQELASTGRVHSDYVEILSAFPFPKINIRKMKKRWGTCFFNKGTITLNITLITKPIPCIEYVVTHELAHFIHPNHSRDFYHLLSIVMPDWKSRREFLNQDQSSDKAL